MSTRAVPASALRAPQVLALLGALACSGSGPGAAADTQNHAVSAEVSACTAAHPAGEPFDVGDVVVASPPPGSGAPEPTPPTVETFAAECRTDGGTDCDARFISREAARCIALDEQFQAGLDEWDIALAYHHSHRRVVWGIQNVLVDNDTDGYAGESLTVDAVNGRVLGRTSWRAVP